MKLPLKIDLTRYTLVLFVFNVYIGESPAVFAEITADIGKLTGEVHKFAFEIVFSQLKSYLSGLSTMEVRKNRLTFFFSWEL